MTKYNSPEAAKQAGFDWGINVATLRQLRDIDANYVARLKDRLEEYETPTETLLGFARDHIHNRVSGAYFFVEEFFAENKSTLEQTYGSLYIRSFFDGVLAAYHGTINT